MKNHGVKNTCRQIGSLFSWMTAIFLPEIQFRMLYYCCIPGRSNRGEGYIQFSRDLHISVIDLILHTSKIIHTVFWPSITVCPSDKEDGCSTYIFDFMNKLTRRGIHFLSPKLLDRGNFALLLQNDIIPGCRFQLIESLCRLDVIGQCPAAFRCHSNFHFVPA